jgi:CheY-like chemotaxis protein
VAVLEGMAASLELGSLRGMLRGVVLDPFEPVAMRGLAEALVGQARRIAEAGRDVEAAALVAEPPPAQERGSETARRRVLVVDDSAMMRRLVREILALDPEFEVVGEAPDGRAALAAMATLQPELTMLDIEMPELDGIGVLRAWALRGPGEVVIVSSAARPGSATALLVRRLGAAGIVGKPSGALSPDLRQRQGEALLRTARRVLGMAA